MLNMRMILIGLLACCLIVMGAGCTDKGTVKSATDVDDEAAWRAQLAEEESERERQMNAETETGSSRSPMSNRAAEKQRALKKLGEYKDPYFDTHPVICRTGYGKNLSSIRLVRMEVVDNRQYEEDLNWGLKVLVENNGPNTMRVNDGGGRISYRIVGPGDRAWVNALPGMGDFNDNPRYTMAEHPGMEIQAEDMRLNEIPPELSNLVLPFCNVGINIDSMRYVVTNPEKGWADLEIGVSNPEQYKIVVSCTLHTIRGLYTSGSASIEKGQSGVVVVHFTPDVRPEKVQFFDLTYKKDYS